MPIPITLQINCGFTRVALRELLSPEELKKRKEIAYEEGRQGFLSLFSSATYGIPEEYQLSENRNFTKCCEKVLDHFSKKWHPPSKRLEYISSLSIENWKHLASSAKEKHTLAFCGACFNNHQLLQHFPGKPVFFPPEPITSLPDS